MTGHTGALMGNWVKLVLPSRLSWVSRYEKFLPCRSGSLVKSIPGTTFWVQNATCSVSSKTLSTTRLSVIRPTTRTGTCSSGMILVESSTSNSKESANSSSNSCTPRSHWGKSPAWIASHRSRRWKSGSAPLILTASFHTTDCTPCTGFQWNLT